MILYIPHLNIKIKYSSHLKLIIEVSILFEGKYNPKHMATIKKVLNFKFLHYQVIIILAMAVISHILYL